VAHSSNLCTEIIEISSEEETAVCNLGSIHLGRHVRHGEFDFEKLGTTVRMAIRFLDRIIDVNFYPTPEAAVSNRKWRPVGLGLMGLQDIFFQFGSPFDCEDALALSLRIQQEIYFHALDESCDLARFAASIQALKKLARRKAFCSSTCGACGPRMQTLGIR
jgi:ribonucleoside-diphosphate reductase alpha chain